MALPAERRLRRGGDITAVLRRGRRARSGALVVHALRRPDAAPASPAAAGAARRPALPSGPRVAFVAPRTVGTAVVRNRTRRRLQAHVVDLGREGALHADVDLVLRLLPDSGSASATELGRALRSALDRLGLVSDGRR